MIPMLTACSVKTELELSLGTNGGGPVAGGGEPVAGGGGPVAGGRGPVVVGGAVVEGGGYVVGEGLWWKHLMSESSNLL